MYKEKIRKDMKKALKEGEKLKVSTLRLLIASIINEEKKLLKELDEQQFFKVLNREIRMRKESITEFEKGGRKELADKERKEKEILKTYLPKQITQDELKTMINSIIEEVEAKTVRDLGKVMGKIIPQVTGRADGKVIKDLVFKALSNLETEQK
ncbi:MAG: GatB/YqeY domain-containing protein [Actinobacteria bacterium]|nr:GatB/YqeY domain-containing protein [Actinomycetota bacterium]